MSESESESESKEILVTPEADALIEPEVAPIIPPLAYESITTEPPVELTPAPAPAPAPAPTLAPVIDSNVPTIDAVSKLGESLHRKLDGLQTLFDREIRAESTREKVVDRLHAELQEYKQGLILSILRPVFVDLIQLHDDIGKMLDVQGDPSDEVKRLVEMIQGYQQGVEDILYRQGVEPFRLEGDVFDPRRQRALSTVPTDDPERNKKVAARVRKGFQIGEKVIRPEMVTVYSFK